MTNLLTNIVSISNNISPSNKELLNLLYTNSKPIISILYRFTKDIQYLYILNLKINLNLKDLLYIAKYIPITS